MRRALELAALGKFTTSPNPAVGAVLVRGNDIVAEAFHARAGEPHAESRVLGVGEAARGTTLYVNLEPCCHVGRTPPCVERIVASGVRRVVAAHADPDPRVLGGGFAYLRARGVEVRSGVLEADARELNRAYLKYLATGLPWVTVKAAISIDGAMAPPGARWITRAATRRHGRVLRREHQAILTGIATVLADDPRLTARPRRGAGNLLRVVLDSSLRTPETAQILTGLDRDPTLLFAAPTAEEAAARRLVGRGAMVERTSLSPTSERELALKPVLRELGRRDIRTVLVEAGPRVTSAFLQEGLADRLVLYIAPRFLGRGEGTGLFDATRQSGESGTRRLPLAQPLAGRPRYARLGPDLLADFRLDSSVTSGNSPRTSWLTPSGARVL